MMKGFGMSTDPTTTTANNASASRAGRRMLWVTIAILVAGVLAAMAYLIWSRGKESHSLTPIFVAKRGPLTINVRESGTISNRDLVILKNEVEGRTTILWLIEEGAEVNEGDILVKLDASSLEDQKTQQQITVDNAEASFVRARESLAVTQSQGESDVAKADLARRFADLDLKKYLQGEYPEQIQQSEADITIAREELQRAEDKLAWSRQLEKEGYLTQTELLADELAVKRSQLNLELAETKLRLLKDFTHQRELAQLTSDVEQTEKALDRARRKAKADDVQAEAELKARQAELEQQKGKLQKNIEQIDKCTIRASASGRAVYSTTGGGHGRRSAQPLEERQEVYQGQPLIYLPTTTSMMAEIKIHESSLRKVHVGMPVNVTVDALPEETFTGTIGKIALFPDGLSRWMNPDLTVYVTEIYLDSNGSALRVGMRCQADIIVEEYDDALYVPVQSVVRVKDQPVVYIQTPDGPEMREVEVGLDNNRMIHIISGVTAGEKVLLAPPLAPSAKPDDQPEGDEADDKGPAEEAPTTKPADEAPKVGPADSGKMTPDERRKAFEGLSPAQQEEIRKRRQQQGGRPPDSGAGGR